MKNEIRVAGVVKNSVVDGPGIRYVVFGQGCSLNCKDCHNPHTHDFNGGELRDIYRIAQEIKSDPLLDGVTFSGGEPFAQTREFAALAALLDGYNIICYTGHTFEELYADSEARVLLDNVDVLIDGKYEGDSAGFNLRFKGSRNQRTIDAKESVKCGKPIEIAL